MQATNNNPGSLAWIAVWSAVARDTPEFTAALRKVKDAGVNHYWIGTGTTDFALKGSETLSAVANKVGLKQFLGGFSTVVFREASATTSSR